MSKINLGQDLGIGQFPTDAEAALIRQNIKIDLALGNSFDPNAPSYQAPIHTLGYIEEGSPRKTRYFKKVGDNDTDWEEILFSSAFNTAFATKPSVVALGNDTPDSVGYGVVANIGDYGYGPSATFEGTKWWFKYGLDDTDWVEVALAKDLAQFINAIRNELEVTFTGNKLIINATAAEVQKATLTEDTEITLNGFSRNRTSIILSITPSNYNLTWANQNTNPAQYTWWSGGSAPDMQNRQEVRLLIESYDGGASYDVTVIGEILI